MERNPPFRYHRFRLISGIHPVKRDLRLSELEVELPEAFRNVKRWTIGILAALYDKNRRGSKFLAKLGNMILVQENTHASQPDIFSVHTSPHRAYINGYWQTAEPFLANRNHLLPQLEQKTPLSDGATQLIALTESTPTGFLHVRRGDYIHFMGEDGLLPPSYYAHAITTLQATGKSIAKWFVFSENIAWAKEHLRFVPNPEFIDYPSPRRDIEDLMIMKSCAAGIIANSSYSWWGAALGDHPNRPVIAPDRYRKSMPSPHSGWALPSWTQLKGWE